MDTVKALELLNAPANIKFNILAHETWQSSLDRKIRGAAIIEWLNSKLKSYNIDMQIENNTLKFRKFAEEKALEHLDAVRKSLPFSDRGMMKKEDVIDVCTKNYLAGYASGMAFAIEEPEQAKKLREQQDAIDVVQQEAEKIMAYIDSNKLLNKQGEVILEL